MSEPDDMTLRDWLAGMALMGICANPDCEPEDVRHNAIVALRNANALIEEMARSDLRIPRPKWR